MATAQSIGKEIEKLREEIRQHEELYYVKANPEISDAEYDKLLERLRKLEEEQPQLITPDSQRKESGEEVGHCPINRKRD